MAERRERLPLLVATDDRVLGWARIAAYSARPAYAGVGEVSVYVHREARGRGVGAGLLVELTLPGNEASVRLVRRNGWREVGLHRRHARLEGAGATCWW